MNRPYLDLLGNPQSGNERWGLEDPRGEALWCMAEAFAACMNAFSGGAWTPVVGTGPHSDGESLTVRVGARETAGKFRFVGTVVHTEDGDTPLRVLVFRLYRRAAEVGPAHTDATRPAVLASLREACAPWSAYPLLAPCEDEADAD